MLKPRGKTIGIVAEYNPFHKGHLYHIRKTRSRGQIDTIIAVISSNFVQRGLPALVDKGVRARMALACGADLALELPVVFSSHNAGLFANAAVDILAATGLVSELSFGMENSAYDTGKLADILNDEPEAFKHAIKKFLSEGFSFVQARSAALDELVPGASGFLKGSNNNLALAYVKRIREKQYSIEPIPLERVGAAYHEREAEDGALASATAIRALFTAGGEEGKKRALSFMPAPAAALLREADEQGRVATEGDRFWRALKLMLLRSEPENLANVAEMREGLEHKMLRLAYEARSFDEFVGACVSKRYPRGRIQRYCTHLLIGLTHEASRSFQKNGPAYIRVLGANERGRELLRTMRKTAALPVVSKASVPKKLGAYARTMMQLEHRATEIWELLAENPAAKAEARFVPQL